MTDPNAARWSGAPGFYEVWYLTLTDRASGVGAWIRYTMLAPVAGRDAEPSCALWFLLFDPAAPPPVARKETLPIGELRTTADPFRVQIGPGELHDAGARGAFGDVAWDLRWERPGGAYAHVHPLLERLGVARTVLTLPHADLELAGTLRAGGREIEVSDARGGQAHLWGTKHAARWAWAHGGDFESASGERRPGVWVDGVSVWVPRLGRETGPATPLVGHVDGDDLLATAPHRVLSADARATLTSWDVETGARGGRRLAVEVDAPRELLAGVTYEDPDGERAYCYNSEVASMRLRLWRRGRLVESLTAPGRAHFEYAQREPIAGVPVLL